MSTISDSWKITEGWTSVEDLVVNVDLKPVPKLTFDIRITWCGGCNLKAQGPDLGASFSDAKRAGSSLGLTNSCRKKGRFLIGLGNFTLGRLFYSPTVGLHCSTDSSRRVGPPRAKSFRRLEVTCKIRHSVCNV